MLASRFNSQFLFKLPYYLT